MISLIQIISVVFGVFMLYMTRVHTKKNYYSAFESYLWLGVWVAFVYVAIFPQTFQGILQSLQIARVFDLLVIVAFMIITFVTLQNRIEIRQIQKKLESLVRYKSLYEKQKQSTKS